jgi:hypothetical protein
MTKTKVEWTLPGDVLDKARLVWKRGVPLASEAAGAEFTPIRVPVKGPASVERGSRYDELRLWLEAWRTAPNAVRVKWKPVQDRVLGKVDLPVAAYLDTVDDVAKALGSTALAELGVFRLNLSITPERFVGFVMRRPMRVVEIGGDWPAVVSAAVWLAENPNSGLHARQIPAEGVHTKIVEQYRRDIAEMVPPPEATADATGKGWFAARYGLATKPPRIRLRFLDPALTPGPWTDVEIPVEEAAANPVTVERILVVENEVSFLTLPLMAGTVAVFGDGRRAGSLVSRIPWLASAPVWYWGDIDTWGLVILDGVRAAVDGRVEVSSLLMDEATLLANQASWVVEEVAADQVVARLTSDEAALYQALVSGRWGDRVRLEQERIRWSDVIHALGRAGFLI